MGFIGRALKAVGDFVGIKSEDVGKFVNDVTGVTSTQNFNKEMASTEYQRALADMKAAGLNPSVLYGQSAGHSASSSGAGGSGIYNAIGGTINSLIHAAVELHEDASPKNKNVAYHTANQMIQQTMAREIEQLRAERKK